MLSVGEAIFFFFFPPSYRTNYRIHTSHLEFWGRKPPPDLLTQCAYCFSGTMVSWPSALELRANRRRAMGTAGGTGSEAQVSTKIPPEPVLITGDDAVVDTVDKEQSANIQIMCPISQFTALLDIIRLNG